jgi:hypothetical protein
MKNTYRFVTALIMMCMLITVVSACDALPFGKPTLTPTITLTPLPTLPGEPLSAEQILSIAIERVNRQTSYSYSAVLSGEMPDLGFTYKSAIGGAALNPDQSYEKVNTNDNGASTNTEYLYIGGKEYTRDNQIGPWEKLPTPDPSQEQKAGNQALIAFEQAANITLVGEEKLNGAIECYHIQFDFDPTKFLDLNDPDFAPTVTNVTSNIWISKADLLIRHWEFEIPFLISETANLTFKGSYDFYSFNQPVLIPTPFFQQAP